MSISEDCKLHYWQLLYRSEAFDKFLGTKFPNVKRYGLEGGESMLVALDRIFEECSVHGVKDVIVSVQAALFHLSTRYPVMMTVS
jgi:probable 2-oxoglutarate dehydrogenase E1 component DHKTD1